MKNQKKNTKEIAFRIIALMLAAMMVLGGATYVIYALVGLL